MVTLDVFGPASQAMRRHDWPWVAGWLSGRFGVDVSANWIASNKPKNGFGSCWSDGSWAMWWKRRLELAGLFRTARPSLNTFDLYGVPLNIGFIGIEETEEMKQRLPEKDGKPVNRIATPGIERTMQKPTPIDRVAARVVAG